MGQARKSGPINASRGDTRPKGWGQQYVIDKLEEGHNLQELMAKAADTCRVSVDTLKNDITEWRNRDERFRLHVEDLLEKLHGSLKVEGVGGRVKVTQEVLTGVLEEMELNGGDFGKACARYKIHGGTVLARLDQRSKYYDANFADRFVALESSRLHTLREKYFALADSEDERIQERVIWNLLKTRLPALHSEKNQLEISGSVTHNHNHRLPIAAIAAARDMASESLARVDRHALPAGDVIDAEVIE